MFGEPVLRSEDPRFLRGEARYLENLPIPGALRAVFVRSMMSHAELKGVDPGAASALEGVVAVYLADDLSIPPMPPSGMVEGAAGHLTTPFLRDVLARDRVRFVGDPIALVIAEDLATAEDAAELVSVELDPLPSVNDPVRAGTEDAPVLFPEVGTNVAHVFEASWDTDVLAGAEVTARGRFVNQRLAPVPMETNGIVVVPDGEGRYTVWVSTQVPFDVRADLADLLGVDRYEVRTIAPDVGGGFGAKLQIYPEYLAVARAAQILGRAVRWSEDRTESMLSLTHGRAQVQEVEIGARRDGTLVGMRVEIWADMGAYPIGAFLPTTTQEMLSGVYAFPAIACRGRSVVTNATPVAPYRGAGRPEATALVERAMDLLATELRLDPAELRRRNLIPPEAFPYRTVSGANYDVGEYERALDEALRLSGYAELRSEQTRRRDRGDHVALGIGLCTYVEVTSFSSREWASIEVGSDGLVTVLAGTSAHGQGHETAFAQIVSATLAVPLEDVRVVHSDTGVVRSGGGTWGSRSLQAGGSAVYEQTLVVAERARALAADLLEVDPDDLDPFAGGGIAVAGAPERRVTWAELGAAASRDGAATELRADGRYRQPGSTFPFGAHVAVVEVDVETGDVRLIRHIAVDDCGRVLNPVLVEGQVHGGLAQGIAQALYEAVVYDDAGNPMTSNLATYAVPSAAEFPWFETARTQTPTPRNPLGVKGIGESACIGSTPAVQNAAVDALAHLGVRHLDLPLSPERVLATIRAARAGSAAVRPPT
jgi:carbon-monoxide dehydrogenase large subunit